MPSPYDLEITETCAGCKFCLEYLFRGIHTEVLQAFDRIKFASTYPKGATLFVEGQAPRGIYVLCAGHVKLTTGSGHEKQLIVRLAEPGEVLGLSATISGEPYHLSAETLEPCQADLVKRDDFLGFLHEYPEVCFRVVEMLCGQLHTAYAQIRSFGKIRPAAETLAGVLLRWCEEKGEETPEGVRFKLPLTHLEMAQMIGCSRETVSRLLREWRQRQIISMAGPILLVLDKAALATKAKS